MHIAQYALQKSVLQKLWQTIRTDEEYVSVMYYIIIVKYKII